MPNHVTTIITANPKVIAAVLREEDGLRKVDFNLLVPMPEEVKGTTGFDSRDERGWYGWSLAHWGTKWNGYSTEVAALPGDLCELRFDTAWSHPAPIVAALARAFPEETIEVEWADEDLGYNVGSYRIVDGELADFIEYESGSDEANEAAARIKYGQTYAEYRAEWG